MAMPVPQKIVLKSSTSMSLNDRFSKISAIRPPSRQTVSVNMMRASVKNQRLAQQMANRDMSLMSNISVLNRIGNANVKSRLGVKRGSTGNVRAFGLPLQRKRGMFYSTPYNQVARRGLTSLRGNPSIRRAVFRNSNRGVPRGRGQLRGSNRGAFNNTRFNNLNNANMRGRGRGRGGTRGRGGMRGGRGGRGSRNASSTTPIESRTEEQLDTELESYMSTS